MTLERTGLKHMDEWSAQELFDFVFKKVYEQGKKATAQATATTGCTYETCVYESPDGSRCAIGHLMPDEVAEVFGSVRGDLFELQDYINNSDKYYKPAFKKFVGVLNKYDDLCDALQGAHDAASTTNFKRAYKTLMIGVADQYELSDKICRETA